jgi:hypothetical protein
VAHEHGYGIVRPFVGHGIGQAMHEEPQVPNYGRPGSGMRIEAGMCFAIEPMFTLGGDDVVVDEDGWTVRTADRSLSAHFENTWPSPRTAPRSSRCGDEACLVPLPGRALYSPFGSPSRGGLSVCQSH